MHIYHSTNELTDPQALRTKLQSARAVEAAGGTIEVSKSFFAPGQTARLVLSLPDGVDPATLGVEGITWEKYEEAQSGQA